MLNASLNYINRLTGIEHTIEGAYGSRKLTRAKGSVNVFHLGYVSKRELYDMMQAYARGFELSIDVGSCDCGTHEEVIDGTVVYYEKCRIPEFEEEGMMHWKTDGKGNLIPKF